MVPTNKDWSPVVLLLHEICYYCYYYSFPCWCCIPAAATTTSASTAWLLFCLYPMACKQRLRPRGCCDGGGLNNKGKKRKKTKIHKFRNRMSAQITSLTNKTKPCMLLCAWPANKDCGPMCCSKAPRPQQPLPANKDCGPVCCSKAPHHNNPHLQTKTAAPCVVPMPPPTTTPTCKQRLRPHVLFQGPPPQQPPPANKDCGPVCCSKAPSPQQPPPANKDCGPVCCSKAPPPQQPPCCCWMVPMVPTNKDWSPVVLLLHEICYYCYYYSFPCWCCIPAAATTTSASTAWLLFCLYPMACKQRLRPRGCCDGGGLNNKGKKQKKQKYTSSGTGCQIRLQAAQNKTNPCMLHGAAVFVSTNNNNNNNQFTSICTSNSPNFWWFWWLVNLVSFLDWHDQHLFCWAFKTSTKNCPAPRWKNPLV